MSTPDVRALNLSEEDTEDLFASPSKISQARQKLRAKGNDSSNAQQPRSAESKYDAEQAKENSLKKELESVRSINELIEGVVSSLETAKGNMEVCSFFRSQIPDNVPCSYICRPFQGLSALPLPFSILGFGFSRRRSTIND